VISNHLKSSSQYFAMWYIQLVSFSQSGHFLKCPMVNTCSVPSMPKIEMESIPESLIGLEPCAGLPDQGLFEPWLVGSQYSSFVFTLLSLGHPAQYIGDILPESTRAWKSNSIG